MLCGVARVATRTTTATTHQGIPGSSIVCRLKQDKEDRTGYGLTAAKPLNLPLRQCPPIAAAWGGFTYSTRWYVAEQETTVQNGSSAKGNPTSWQTFARAASVTNGKSWGRSHRARIPEDSRRGVGGSAFRPARWNGSPSSKETGIGAAVDIFDNQLPSYGLRRWEVRDARGDCSGSMPSPGLSDPANSETPLYTGGGWGEPAEGAGVSCFAHRLSRGSLTIGAVPGQ